MKRMRTAAAAAALIALVGVALSSCGSDDSPEDESSVSEIIYTYVGPSTPPEYHQEYRIVVAPGEATIRVGTYGTVDGSQEPEGTATVPISEEVWSDLVDGTSSLPSAEDDEGCTGGSTQTIQVEDGDGPVRDASIYGCGDANEQTSEQLEGLIAPVLSQFDLEELDDRT